MYLLDSDILINYSKAFSEEILFLDEYFEDCFVSYISYGEMLMGARDKVEQNSLNKLLEPFEIDYGSKHIVQLAIDILKTYRLKHGLGLNDSVIAATAILQDAILLTKNIKHFNFIPDLKVKSLKDFKD